MSAAGEHDVDVDADQQRFELACEIVRRGWTDIDSTDFDPAPRLAEVKRLLRGLDGRPLPEAACRLATASVLLLNVDEQVSSLHWALGHGQAMHRLDAREEIMSNRNDDAALAHSPRWLFAYAREHFQPLPGALQKVIDDYDVVARNGHRRLVKGVDEFSELAGDLAFDLALIAVTLDPEVEPDWPALEQILPRT